MTKGVLLLGLILLVTAGASGSSESLRKPTCADIAEILACPMNMAPVCGTDGQTYANECLLCVERLKTKSEIMITKDADC